MYVYICVPTGSLLGNDFDERLGGLLLDMGVFAGE